MIDKRKTLKLMSSVEHEVENGQRHLDTRDIKEIEKILEDLKPQKVANVGYTFLPFYNWV